MAAIRPRTEDDIEGCVACLKRVYDKDRYPVSGVSNAQEFLSGDVIQQAWVAEKNSIIKGHVTANRAMESDISVALWRQKHPESKIAVLGRLFVDPDSRGSGLAARLIANAVSWANERNMRLVLFVLLKDRGATKLYEKLGWSYFGTQVFHYGDGQQMDALCFASPEPIC